MGGPSEARAPGARECGVEGSQWLGAHWGANQNDKNSVFMVFIYNIHNTHIYTHFIGGTYSV